MDALVSGRAGVAVVLGSEPFLIDERGIKTPVSLDAIPLMLHGYGDLLALEDVPSDTVVDELILHTATDDSLHLTLILLDRDMPRDVRVDAAGALEELVQNTTVKNFLASVMYAHPLPLDA